MIGDDKTIKNILGKEEKVADNTISAILRFIKTMQVPASTQDRANQIWRKIVKSSFYSHLCNYLRHESKNIQNADAKYLRQQKMLRSVLVGDLGMSIVTTD